MKTGEDMEGGKNPWHINEKGEFVRTINSENPDEETYKGIDDTLQKTFDILNDDKSAAKTREKLREKIATNKNQKFENIPGETPEEKRKRLKSSLLNYND